MSYKTARELNIADMVIVGESFYLVGDKKLKMQTRIENKALTLPTVKEVELVLLDAQCIEWTYYFKPTKIIEVVDTQFIMKYNKSKQESQQDDETI